MSLFPFVLLLHSKMNLKINKYCTWCRTLLHKGNKQNDRYFSSIKNASKIFISAEISKTFVFYSYLFLLLIQIFVNISFVLKKHTLFDQSINRSINQSTNRPIDQSINRPIDQSANRSIDQSINRPPVDQSTSRAIDQSINRPVDQPGQSTSRSIDQSINRPVYQLTNRSIDQSISFFSFKCLFHFESSSF